MGASSLPRKNPFMAQGLVAGLTLRLDLSRSNVEESHVTRVEDVTEGGISVLVPMRHLRPRPLPTGALIHAVYIHQQKRYRFVTEVVGHSADGHHDILRLPGAIDSSERRRWYRLHAAIKPQSLYRLVIDGDQVDQSENMLEGMVVDLSEGGLCLNTRSFVMTGERLGLIADLPEAGEVRARMRVTSVDEPAAGNRNRRVHCEFIEISRAHRDVIARYLMRRQLEMRRRGQL
jgi:c-di-GMP-binding flagellar brake protein YcgR